MKLSRLVRALPALLLALLPPLVLAQAAPASTAPATEARVIVKFREGAGVTQRYVLSAGAQGRATTAVAQVMQGRAQALSQRLALPLQAGRALDERTQVLRASGVTAEALARRLGADPDVEYAVVDQRRRALRVPNDPLYLSAPSPAAGQWYLHTPDATVRSAINAAGAWDVTTGSSRVVVAVLDTGVRYDHPDLAGKLLPGYDFVSLDRDQSASTANDGDGRDADASDPGDWVTASEANQANGRFEGCGVRNSLTGRFSGSPSSWHGTMVSGLIAATTDNGIGMAGTGWSTRVLPVRVLGKCFGYDSDIVAGMRWAAGLSVPGLPDNPTPAKVLNLSLGGTGSCTSVYADAVSQLLNAGKVIVAAAGNSAGLAVGVPANCSGVIGVAGLRHTGTKVGFSDVGPEVALSAPGGNCVNASGTCLYPILTTDNNGSTSPADSTYTDGSNISVGTSFSAPLVSATAALMFSARPELTPADVVRLLKQTARPFPSSGAEDGSTQACRAPNGAEQLECYCTTSTCGAGMLDTAAAVQAAAALGAPVTAPSAVPTVVANASTATPAVGETVTLTASGSQGNGGALIDSGNFRWTVVQGGGAAQLSTATGPSTSVLLTGGGTVVIRLSAIDSAGVANATDVRLAVSGGDSGGGGGGALGWGWLGGLALAVLALWRRPQPRV